MIKTIPVAGAPDLVVEVISPSSVDYDRTTKFDLYQEIGVREYWLVDPGDRSVDVFVSHDGRFERLDRFGAGASARSSLLEGFTVAVDPLFA